MSPYISAVIGLARCSCPTRQASSITGEGPGVHWYTASVHDIDRGTVRPIEVLATPDKVEERIASMLLFSSISIHWVKPGRVTRYLPAIATRDLRL